MSLPPPIMPIVSRGVPAYTNDDFSGSFPASQANNTNYHDYWRCQTITVSGNSGALTQAVYLAYDLSGVASAQRHSVVVVWYNDPLTGNFNPVLSGGNSFNVPADYTIDANTASGGSLPSSGWVTLATVTGNPYHSRQHAIDLTSYNWLRIRVTAVNGSASNNNVALNMDVHNATAGNQDNFIFYGDSITMRGLDHSGTTVPTSIAATYPTYFPLMEDGGTSGLTAVEGAANISTWLANFSGKYVSLNFGSNDGSQGGTYLTNFQANMTTMISAVISAGKVPIIPKIIWGTAGSLSTSLPVLNGIITTLYGLYPSVIPGPDLYNYFFNNQSLIGGDNLHPVDPGGYDAYRAQWVNWALAKIYAPGTGDPNVFAFSQFQFGKIG